MKRKYKNCIMGILKIVEAGRILAPEESEQLLGGCPGGYSSDCADQYVGCNKHDECGILVGYIACHPAGGSFGYETTCSDGAGHTTCATEQYYSSCSGKRDYTTCSGGVSHGGLS